MRNKSYYDSKVEYYNIHKINKYGNPIILDLVNENSTVYDIGCNIGSLGFGLKKYKKCRVYGIDVSPKAVKKADSSLFKAKVVDLETTNKFPFSDVNFDYIVLADVLEHIKNPEEVLIIVKKQLKFKQLIVSIPNIGFMGVRLNLLFGKFDYTDYGIMDESHLHFYTLKTARELFSKCGYEEISLTPFPLTNKKFSKITHPLTRLFPTLFARQFVFLLK